ncbi:transcriptional regulatory protein ZraR [Clostridium homopropionicum DSM 5847]|uniref:Transcriptional regulatory protein ZraR n=1 Tax=Clostridium homopropionicum DSM 5847 TaxID=1121318 RepID=A0A0L6ZBM5_9CLOT|nr:sigma-54-dependent Fis family transcriptional regulator [Clostridium homopropionicum]KOA20362.1 transcriptional regulatory protein ZraR [Clostridium homopropionicum DSM 5847]SFG74145.1 PAS domain S-box-containing protein [Clostridium homopropionicum]
MKIKEVMNKSNITLSIDNNLLDALKLFTMDFIEAINIVDENNLLVGIITKDLVIKKLVENLSPNTSIRNINLDKSLIIDEDCNLEDCINKNEKVMGVKNKKGEAVGIFSLSYMNEKHFNKILERLNTLKHRLKCITNECGEVKLNCLELDAVIESSYDGIYVTDGNANTIKINKAYETITGLKRENMLNRNMHDLVKEGYVSKSGTLIVLKTKKSATIIQDFKSGKRVLISSNPIFDKYGNITMVVTNVRDVTELYELEEELAKNKKLTEKYYSEIEAMRAQLLTKSDLVAEDKKTIDLLEVVKRVSKVDTTILLLGETGVGKEEVAKYIHKNSLRSDKNFIKINCGAIPENLIESELFGYEKGAFTGANREGKMGLFEVADGGTMFLDEVGELPLNVQVKLLRVLQESEIERVGGVKPIKVDVRIIAATNRDLEEMIVAKTFRSDLFYRLNVVPLTIPSLRERREDIIPLVQYYLSKLNSKYKLKKSFSAEAIKAMYNYNWPGNVRELKNMVERVVVMSSCDKILKSDLPISNHVNAIETSINCGEICNLKDAVEKVEAELITKAFNKAGNVREAAKILGIDAATFVRKRKRYIDKKLLQ